MAEIRVRRLENFYNQVLDRLGMLHTDNMNYQEQTFIMDAHTVGKHIHSMIVAAGDNYYDTSIKKTIAQNEDKTAIPTPTDEVAQIKRIWRVDSDDKLKHLLHPRRIDSAEIYVHNYPDYEVIGTDVYWFPKEHGEFIVRME